MKKILALILCAAMISCSICAIAEEEISLEERIEVLEKLVESLEERLKVMENIQQVQQEKTEQKAVSVGEMTSVQESFNFAVMDFDFGSRFTYYTSSYFGNRTRSISANQGYRILKVDLKIENLKDYDLEVEELLSAKAIWQGGEDDAYNDFFYLTSNTYYGGVAFISGKMTAEGALLFAVPEEQADGSGKLSIRFDYDGQEYICDLRTGEGTRSIPTGDNTLTF